MKKILSTLLLLFACAVSVQAQESVQGEAQKQEQVPQRRQTREEYVEKYKSIAIAHMKRFGIPASITMAQGILESDCGNSPLARMSNNHFGIKCKKNWTGKKVYHDDDEKGECFRAYPTVEASYEDHAKFLDDSPRYDSLFAYPSNDYRSWARGLKAAGYATAPDYAVRLIKIIENTKLYLLDEEALKSENTKQESGPKEYIDRSKGSKSDEKGASDTINNSTASDSDNRRNDVAVSDEHVNPNAFRVTVNSHKGYSVYRANQTSYVVAKKGDTIESIGEIFDISPSLLRRFNDLNKDEKIAQGDIVYIEPKKEQWHGDTMQHKVGKNENLYLISQLYGIRVKSLAKLNKLADDEAVKAGDIIRLK